MRGKPHKHEYVFFQKTKDKKKQQKNMATNGKTKNKTNIVTVSCYLCGL